MARDIFIQGGGRQVSEQEARAFAADVLAWLDRTGQLPTQLEQAARGTTTGIITYCLRGGGTNPTFMNQVRQIMAEWPQGWPIKGLDGAMPPLTLAFRQESAAKSLRWRKRGAAQLANAPVAVAAPVAIAAAKARAAAGNGPPDVRDRVAWEAYWLAKEQPGLDGRKHRTTPLWAQVA